MGCNAYNHYSGCDCGWGGDTGGGGGRRRSSRSGLLTIDRPSIGWSRARGDGTVASYVNPNARCPVCDVKVFFYRSPYDGRVYFDELGPPWPKHWCTDSSRWRTESNRTSFRATGVSASPAVGGASSPREERWEPLCSSNTSVTEDRMTLSGEVQRRFTEIALFEIPKFDGDGPIFIRPHQHAPGFYVIAVLQSDRSGVRERYHLAFDRKLSSLGADVLSRAVNDEDAIALAELGRYLLYELGDLSSADVYLGRAYAAGADVLLDLAVVAVLARDEPFAAASAPASENGIYRK